MEKAYFQKYKHLEKYLGSELYCREERQYAVFLYNIFLKMKMNITLEPDEKVIIKNCLNSDDIDDIVIDNVFFEATLMRDYFEKEREKDKKRKKKGNFNKKLLRFCLKWLSGDDKLISDFKNFYDVNLGQKEFKKFINKEYGQIDIFEIDKFEKDEDRERAKEKAKEKVCLDIARMMMNATPDLLVVYTTNGTKYAKALECKYESDEGRYEDMVGSKCKMQLFIQECIMHFCFGCSKNEKGKYIPIFPDGSKKWKKNINLWESICFEVYKGILEQTMDNAETSEVRNKGVEMVRFCRPTKGTKERNLIHISENVCIEVYIEQGEVHPLALADDKWRYVK